MRYARIELPARDTAWEARPDSVGFWGYEIVPPIGLYRPYRKPRRGRGKMTQLGTQPELSLVIPVFDGSASIARVAETILREYRDLEFEIIRVMTGRRTTVSWCALS